MRNKNIKNSIALFLSFAFGLPLICVLLEKNVFKSGMINFILFGIEAAAPTLASIIVISIFSGKIGIQEFFKKCYLKNIKLNYILLGVITPILLGTIWALWHYHFFWLGTMSIPALPFLLGCIADSFGYYWVTKKSKGNVIPASLWHFTYNLFMNILLITPEFNHGSMALYWTYVIYSIIAAVIISIWGMTSMWEQPERLR